MANIEFLKESLKLKLAEAGVLRKQIAALQQKTKSVKPKPTTKPIKRNQIKPKK